MEVPRTTTIFTISLPRDIAEQLDELTKKERRTRSEFIREALRRYMAARARGATPPRGFELFDSEGLMQFCQTAPCHAEDFGYAQTAIIFARQAIPHYQTLLPACNAVCTLPVTFSFTISRLYRNVDQYISNFCHVYRS